MSTSIYASWVCNIDPISTRPSCVSVTLEMSVEQKAEAVKALLGSMTGPQAEAALLAHAVDANDSELYNALRNAFYGVSA